MSNRKVPIILSLLLVLVMLGACASPPAAAPSTQAPAEGEQAPAEQPTEAPTAEPQEQTLIVGVGHELETLDPARAYNPFSTMVNRATYNALLTFAPGDISELEPDLAESWEISPDGLVYTFTLRDGVTFQSGNPLTSQDVKWSWERVQGIQGNPSFLFENIASIETPDDRTVVLTLTDSDPAILTKLTDMAFAVLDSEEVKAHGGVSGPDAAEQDTAQEWLDQHSAGTGPFRLVEWKLESEITLEKWADSWRGEAGVDRVIFKHLPQTATRKLELEAGDIDIALGLSAEQAQSLESNPEIEVVTGPGLETFFLLANQNPELSDGVMSDQRVVDALRYAVDYEGVKVLAGFAAMTSPTSIPIGLFAAWDESKALSRDVEKARQLLAEAGYPDGVDVTLRYPTEFSTSGVDFDIVAEKIQADLTEAGFNVTLQPEELMANLEQYRAGNLAFTFWAWLPDYPDINVFLEFLPGGIVANRAQWTEDQVPERILELRDQARTETDPQKRVEIWNELQEFLLNEGPFVNIVQAGLQIGLRNNIDGYVYNQMWLLDPFLITKQ